MDVGAGSSDVLGEGASGVTTAGRTSSNLESELENVCRELELLEHKISQMLQQQTALCARREQLSAEIQARKKRREFSSSKFVASRMQYNIWCFEAPKAEHSAIWATSNVCEKKHHVLSTIALNGFKIKPLSKHHV